MSHPTIPAAALAQHTIAIRKTPEQDLYFETLERLPHYVFRRIEVAPTGCWIWIGGIQSGGYGHVVDKRPRDEKRHRMMLAHRFVYEELVGPIPDGLHLDHLCRVRPCVNPEHLEPVTVLENNLRSAHCNKTHCKHGHALTGENSYVQGRSRECRTCRRIQQRRFRARRKREASQGRCEVVQ